MVDNRQGRPHPRQTFDISKPYPWERMRIIVVVSLPNFLSLAILCISKIYYVIPEAGTDEIYWVGKSVLDSNNLGYPSG